MSALKIKMASTWDRWRAKALLTGMLLVAAQSPLAQAQSGATAPPSSQEPDLMEITVTATRVQRSGYEAPTPTTIVNSAMLEEQGLTNVADLLNQVPAFRGSDTPTTSPFTFNGSGGNYVNLRDLGTNRVVVLLDGNRVVPSTSTGTTDLNLIPTIAIGQTEVVTGGASAAYGSDAVTGVVNLRLKNDFVGFQSDVQLGESTHHDSREDRLSILSGTNLWDGAAHLLVAAEYDKNSGVGTQNSRPWANNAVASLAGPDGTTIVAPDVQFSIFAPGSVIGFGPLAGTSFNSSGQPIKFNPGTSYPESAPFQFGGGNGQGLAYYTATIPMEVPVTRYSGLAKLDADLGANLKGWVEFNYGHSGSDHSSVPLIGGGTGPLCIQADNAYLPKSIAAQLFPFCSATPSILVGYMNLSAPYFAVASNDTYRVAAGVQGQLPGTWTWDAHVEYGINHFSSALENDVLDQGANNPWSLATDAVDYNGSVVCRSTITNPGNGCAPFNIFGVGTYSAAALAYVTGTSWESQQNTQYNAAINLHGDPFSTWAGKVSLATGYEYRRDMIVGKSDMRSQEQLFDVFNPQPIEGSIYVNELYAESVVPLLADQPLAKSLDVDAAVREADYEYAGDQTTYKFGLTYVVDSQFRLRASRSRDIRAPNLQESFAAAQTGQTTAPTGYTAGSGALIETDTTGNKALQPEKSDTTSFGFTVTPEFVPHFHFTADYYDIDIKGAIGTVGVPALLAGCTQQHIELDCAQISFGVNNTIVNSVILQPINADETKTSGIDFEVGYNFSALGGQFDVRTLGSFLQSITSTNCGNVNRAGEISSEYSGCAFDGPRWTWDGNIHYTQGPVGFNAHVRYIAASVLDADDKAGGINAGLLQYPNGSDANGVASRTYVNLSADYTILFDGSKNTVQLYAGVNNAFNEKPPSNVGFAQFGATNVSNYYDPIGTAVFIGARAKF